MGDKKVWVCMGQMPRMQGAAVQCCMCIVGVFMFLGGVIMLATGISLILNYGVFDITLLPPDLNNDEGKKTVGIILTVCGFLAITVSVIVSVIYLCHKTKSSINPDTLTRIPTSSRTTPDRTDRRTGHHKHPGGANGVSRPHHHAKHTPGSTEVKVPRSHRKPGRNHRKKQRMARIEELKEDAISRKTVEAALASDRTENASYCSDTTIDETAPKPPKVVFDDYSDRPPSECSTSTSLYSETSSTRFMDDKSRRELQFMSEPLRSAYTRTKDDTSMDQQYDETSLVGNKFDECSITSEGIVNPAVAQEYSINQEIRDTDSRRSAGGMAYNNGSTQSDPQDTDSSIVSYKTSHKTQTRGEQTQGRVSPQIDELETYTQLEEQRQHYQST